MVHKTDLIDFLIWDELAHTLLAIISLNREHTFWNIIFFYDDIFATFQSYCAKNRIFYHYLLRERSRRK